MTTSAIPTMRCPHCGDGHDRATCVAGERLPEEGDISICIACGNWSAYGPDLSLQSPDAIQQAFIASDEDCQMVARAWREAHRTRLS